MPEIYAPIVALPRRRQPYSALYFAAREMHSYLITVKQPFDLILGLVEDEHPTSGRLAHRGHAVAAGNFWFIVCRGGATGLLLGHRRYRPETLCDRIMPKLSPVV